MRDTALERDRLVLRAPHGLSVRRGTAHGSLHDLASTLEPAQLARARDIAALPLDPEPEAPAGIDALTPIAEPRRRRPHVLRMRDLLDLDDHEFGWLQGGEADDDVDNAAVDVVLGRRIRVALDEIGALWS